MKNSLETIKNNLADFEGASPYPLEPFWDIPAFSDDPYWGEAEESLDDPLVLVISGPSRNGNHLVHGMLDGHSQFPSVPGEDSFYISAFLSSRQEGSEQLRRCLQGSGNVEGILLFNGYGFDKWREYSDHYKRDGGVTTDVWSGTQEGDKVVTDYQDTVAYIDYQAYHQQLVELAPQIREAPTFMNASFLYLDALSKLDPEHGGGRYFSTLVASGMRAELRFIFERSKRFRCITPIRPFETYYFSFAKGRFSYDGIREDILHEAWEHWFHKTTDYLLLKKLFPEFICLVNYENIINAPEDMAREICRFLQIDFQESCLMPTVMGTPTKGNSSFPKDDEYRGVFYSSGMKKRLPKEHWPETYPALWKMVEMLSL